MSSKAPPALFERDLYKPVRKWLESRGFYCGRQQSKDDGSTRWWTDVGPQRTRLDVVGAKSLGGARTDVLELVGVEVKKSERATVAHINQALGYRRFVDRIYFAKPGDYRAEVIQEAVRFGVGLLSLRPKKKKAVKVVLTPGVNTPMPEQRAALLKELWLVQCRLCGMHFERFKTWEDVQQPSFVTLNRTSVLRSREEGSMYQPVLCRDCALLLGYTKVPTPDGGFRLVAPAR